MNNKNVKWEKIDIIFLFWSIIVLHMKLTSNFGGTDSICGSSARLVGDQSQFTEVSTFAYSKKEY